MRVGRATQRLLFLPKVLWIVSEEEPGLSRHAIRNSANALAIPFGVSAVIFLVSWDQGINILQDKLAFTLGVAFPISSVLAVWYVLAESQHARSTHPPLIDLEMGEAKPFNDYGLDEDGVRIIKQVWLERHPDIFTGCSNGPPNYVPMAETAPRPVMDILDIESAYGQINWE